jgi:molybdopterin-guanine dinucleotide biosynthesis protein A
VTAPTPGRDSQIAGAIVLAGGAARRLGRVDKPLLSIAGQPLLQHVLNAVGNCSVVVVGPDRELTGRARSVRENPPLAGPAAAAVAGLEALLPELTGPGPIALLAGDLPAIEPATIARLARRLIESDRTAQANPPPDGAVLVDSNGREQLLLGVWHSGSLQRAAAKREHWSGASMRDLLSPLRRLAVPAVGAESADIDTPDDLRRWRRSDDPGPDLASPHVP